MKEKLKFKWKKGWDIIDEAQGGYAETAVGYIDYIASVPLLKSKVANVWYIGELHKHEKPTSWRTFYNEQIAKKEFQSVKQFIESELASRHRFKNMSKIELTDWLNKLGQNKYVGISLYYDIAKREAQMASKKDIEM